MEPGSSRAGKSEKREDHVNIDIDGSGDAERVIEDAHQVFDEMPQREEVGVMLSFTAKTREPMEPSFSTNVSCITDVGKSSTSTHDGDHGEKKCVSEGCTKNARGMTPFCIRHGGKKTCEFAGCKSNAQGRTSFCRAHGGGWRCVFAGCTKPARGTTSFCEGHGGGLRCETAGCTKCVRGTTSFCKAHGEQRRCKYKGCNKVAKGRISFCKAHRVGKGCSWVSGEDKCGNLASTQTGFCDIHSELQITKTGIQSDAVSESGTPGPNKEDTTDQSCIESSAARHGFDDTVRRWTGDSEKVLMFYILLTPSDVGASEHLFIPTEHAQKYFPQLYDIQEKEGLLLDFEDSNGKIWSFCYSYLSNIENYAILKGWSCFVKRHQLAPDDVVFFYRGVGEEGEKKLFIQWSRGVGAAPVPSPPLSLHLPKPAFQFDRMVANNALIYCGLFPPDYEFQRETMMQLWIADDIFVDEPMNWIANLFFEDCLTKGYILPLETGYRTGKFMYKVHASTYLVPLRTLRLNSRSSHVARIESDSNLKDSPPDVSHLSVSFPSSEDSTVLGEFEKFKQLRTLLFLQSHELSFKQIPHDLFLSLGMLRSLDLSRTHLIELPSSIKKMTCLRYLNLSDNPLRRLPEVIDCLENLQTLKLRGCSDLSTLPNGMSKLVNLHHLDFDVLQQLHSMPERMGALTKIRTLSAFLIGEDEDCSILQLKNMNNILGGFCISGLENVLTEEEALEACMWCKSELTKLDLRWNDSPDEGYLEDHVKVLTSLQPNACLQD